MSPFPAKRSQLIYRKSNLSRLLHPNHLFFTPQRKQQVLYTQKREEMKKNRQTLILWCSFCTLITITLAICGGILVFNDFDAQSFCKETMTEQCALGNLDFCNCIDDARLMSQSCDTNSLINKKAEEEWTNYYQITMTCKCSDSVVCVDISAKVQFERIMKTLLVIIACLFPLLGLCVSLALC